MLLNIVINHMMKLLRTRYQIDLEKDEIRIKDLSVLNSSDCSCCLNSNNLNDFELKLFNRGEDLRKSLISNLIATKIWHQSKRRRSTIQ